MPHTISVNQPNLAPSAPVETEWGTVYNGSSISLTDEQVAVWKVQNPGRELPTKLDHSESKAQNEEAIKALPEDKATVLREDLERLKGLDLSTETAPPAYEPVANNNDDTSGIKEGDS